MRFAPGSSVSMVARQYDVNANQVFNWRKRYRDEPRAPAVLSAPQLPGAQAVPRASAARAGNRAGTDRLPLLRGRAAAQAG